MGQPAEAEVVVDELQQGELVDGFGGSTHGGECKPLLDRSVRGAINKR
jgi:hypothetical protein